jgi:hypothetical protein
MEFKLNFTKFICIFELSLLTKFEILKKCLISCEIANLTKNTQGTVTAHMTWAAYPCVYSGVWRYLQECKDGSPLFYG